MGVQELVGAFTVFSFLMWLRVADDFKDYELDCRLFADRPLPAGEVSKRDLIILMLIMIPGTLLLNLLLMPNFWFCLFLYTYGSLMAVWFFQKHKIQPSLPLALFTHNPVQIILNIYVLSFTIIKYHLPAFDWMNFLAVFTLRRHLQQQLHHLFQAFWLQEGHHVCGDCHVDGHFDQLCLGVEHQPVVGAGAFGSGAVDDLAV